MNLNLGKRPFLYSFVLSIVFSLIPYTFLTPYRQTNDDFYIGLTTQGWGVAAHPSEYIFCANIIASFLLKSLNAWNNYIPWHGLYLIFGLFLSVWAYLAALITSPNCRQKLFLFALFYLGVDFYFVLFIHFTSIAILCFQAGFFLLLSMWRNQTFSFKAALLSGSCFFISALLRFEAFLLSGLLILPFAIYIVPFFKTYPFKRKIVASLAVIIFLTFGSAFFNLWCFNQKPDWKYFYANTTQYTNLVNFQNMPYVIETKPSFDQIHWDINDLNLFQSWYWMDDVTFNVKNLIFLNHSLPLITENHSYPFDSVFQNETSRCALILILCCLLGLSCSDVFWVVMAFLWVFIIHGLMFLFAKSPPWVYTPLFVFPLHLFIYFSKPYSGDDLLITSHGLKPRLHFNYFLISAMAFCTVTTAVFYYQKEVKNKAIELRLKNDIQLLNPHNNQLFVVWSCNLPYESTNVLDSNQNFKTFHIFQLQGDQLSPTSTALLNAFHVKDLQKDIIDNPNIYMICNLYQGYLFINHIKKRLDRDVCLKLVFHSNTFNVFQIVSKKNVKNSKIKRIHF